MNLICIDGPSASGKTTLSRLLSERLGWEWISTGAFYRCLAYMVEASQVDPGEEKACADLLISQDWSVEYGSYQSRVVVAGQDVTSDVYQESVGAIASQVSAYPLVRSRLLEAQRNHYKGEGLIAEGRDCGTVIFPQAPLKFFLEARSDQRAQRRLEDQTNVVKDGATQEIVLEDLMQRDQRDSSRKVAPLKKAEDAIFLDTTDLSIEGVLDKALSLAKDRGFHPKF